MMSPSLNEDTNSTQGNESFIEDLTVENLKDPIEEALENQAPKNEKSKKAAEPEQPYKILQPPWGDGRWSIFLTKKHCWCGLYDSPEQARAICSTDPENAEEIGLPRKNTKTPKKKTAKKTKDKKAKKTKPESIPQSIGSSEAQG